MNPDFVDLLRVFNARNVRYLIVGAYALGVHGRPRATGDLVPPRRIDVITALTALTFAEAWPNRVRSAFGPVEANFIGRSDFIANKRATGRTRDLGDVESLQ